jgi:hypothetical protein
MKPRDDSGRHALTLLIESQKENWRDYLDGGLFLMRN